MRPEGFNPRKISDVILKDWNAQRMVEEGEHIAPLLVEAGADAYEEGLKKEGCWITSNHSSKINFTDDNYTESSPLMAFIKRQRKAGYLVFIPEEKE